MATDEQMTDGDAIWTAYRNNTVNKLRRAIGDAVQAIIDCYKPPDWQVPEPANAWRAGQDVAPSHDVGRHPDPEVAAAFDALQARMVERDAALAEARAKIEYAAKRLPQTGNLADTLRHALRILDVCLAGRQTEVGDADEAVDAALAKYSSAVRSAPEATP